MIIMVNLSMHMDSNEIVSASSYITYIGIFLISIKVGLVILL